MSEGLIVLDTNVIINLFAGRGAAAWDNLFSVGKRIIVLDVILEELPGAVKRVKS